MTYVGGALLKNNQLWGNNVSADNAELKLRDKQRKENNRNKRIDGSSFIHMHTYTYRYT